MLFQETLIEACWKQLCKSTSMYILVCLPCQHMKSCWFSLRLHGWNVTLGKPWGFDEHSIKGTKGDQLGLYDLSFIHCPQVSFTFLYIGGITQLCILTPEGFHWLANASEKSKLAWSVSLPAHHVSNLALPTLKGAPKLVSRACPNTWWRLLFSFS